MSTLTETAGTTHEAAPIPPILRHHLQALNITGLAVPQSCSRSVIKSFHVHDLHPRQVPKLLHDLFMPPVW
jgi:hypothetical protein